jgi:hypothetical protein
MNRAKKIYLIVGIIGVAIGGFVLTKWLTRNVKRVKGFIIVKQTFDEKPTYSEIGRAHV